MSADPVEIPAPAERKQQQRSVITQHKLLDAAVEAFSENGFKGTSTRDIAERAGVHHPLITYHFKNKDLLWRAAADRVFREFRHALGASLENYKDESPRERLASMIRAYVYYARSQPALHKVLIQEASYPNERLDWLIDTHLKPFFDDSTKLIADMQALGVIPPGDPKLLFQMIRMCSGGLLALGNELRTSCDIEINDDETLDEIAAIVIRLFLSGENPQPD